MLEFITNKMIYIPILVWFGTQLIKVLLDSITTKNLNLKRIVGSGGMPSSHSAVVCSLTSLIGKNNGYDSGLFALSVIFSIIVMYDAAGIRQASGKHAKVLNEIIETNNYKLKESPNVLNENLGHTPLQVIIGAIIGIIVGNLV